MIGSLSHLVRAARHHRDPGRHRGRSPASCSTASRSTTPPSPPRGRSLTMVWIAPLRAERLPGRSSRSRARPAPPTWRDSLTPTGWTLRRSAVTSPRTGAAAPPIRRASVQLITGIPAPVFRNAIPNLDPAPGRAARRPLIPRRGDDGPACRMCVLARGITQPVRCWKRPEQVICLRHRRWIAPNPNSEDDQPALRRTPRNPLCPQAAPPPGPPVRPGPHREHVRSR